MCLPLAPPGDYATPLWYDELTRRQDMSGLLPAIPHPPMAPMSETAEGHRDLLRLVEELRDGNGRQYTLILKGEAEIRRQYALILKGEAELNSQKGLLHDSQNNNSELLKVIAQREQRIAAQVVTITKLREAESVVYAQAGVSKTELMRRDHATQCRIIEAFKAEGAVKDKRLTERASEADKLSTIIDDQRDDIDMYETALRETNSDLVDAMTANATSYRNGHRNGYRDGHLTVADSSYRDGKAAGMDEGYRDGKTGGRDEGYRDGKAVMISILRDKLDACEQEYDQS